MSKYNSKKVEYQGILFDSKKEMNRWIELKEMEEKEEIFNLERQVEFELIPKQYDSNGKVLFQPVRYKADMVYNDSNGNVIVEDVKSKFTRTLPDYTLKRKMMWYLKKILVVEIV